MWILKLRWLVFLNGEKFNVASKMDIKYLKSYILENWFDGDSNVKAVVGGDDETMVMKSVVELLEREEKFELHDFDLRKNPNDLPELYIRKEFRIPVIAWRKIKPFEEMK